MAKGPGETGAAAGQRAHEEARGSQEHLERESLTDGRMCGDRDV